VDDEATVKRLRIKKQSVELVAENPAFAPIVVRPDRVALIGKVIEIRRYLDDFRRPPLRQRGG
jgi:SOS-response transcriptional repressor LexA